MGRRYWLLKSEPNVYSIDDLCTNKVDYWEGVRNYQARNMLRDELQVGDGVLFYHSNAKPPGVAGIAEVHRAGYPDHTAFDPESKYYDPKSDPDQPRWFMVDIQFVEKFAEIVPLAVLQATPGLEDMMVTKKGMRLSVQPVTTREWNLVARLGRRQKSKPAGTRAETRKPLPGQARKSPRSRQAARKTRAKPA